MIFIPVAQFFTDFKKRRNSTKRPTIDPQYNVNVEFKQPTDIYHPTLIIRGVDSYEHVTYMYMDGWYYYVNRIVSNRDFWEVSAEIDELATWKENIGSHSTIVTRASSASNPAVIDHMYPITTAFSTDVQYASVYESGTYICPVTSKFGITYYAFSTKAGLDDFVKTILDRLNYEGDDFLDQVLGWVTFDAKKFIGRTYYLPFNLSVLNTGVAVGDYLIKKNGSYYSAPALTSQTYSKLLGMALNVTKHPLAETRGTYLNSAPFTERRLVLPPFGTIPMSDVVTGATSAVNLKLRCDAYTGDCTLKIMSGETTLKMIACNLACDLDITGVAKTVNPNTISNAISNGIGTAYVGGAILGGPGAVAMGVAGASAGAIGSLVNNSDYFIAGASGNKSDYEQEARLESTFHVPADEDNANRGRPYMTKVTLSSLSGYMVCDNGNVNTSAPEPYKTSIKNYLESGFYYE